MKPILSQAEIDQIILDTKDGKLALSSDYKIKSGQFQEILSQRDERTLLLLISSLYMKSKQDRKGLTAGDMRVLKTAEGIIEHEFAFSLHIETKDVSHYIKTKLGITQ